MLGPNRVCLTHLCDLLKTPQHSDLLKPLPACDLLPAPALPPPVTPSKFRLNLLKNMESSP